MNTITRKDVLVADDHPLLLRGIQDMLLASAEFRIVAACADGVVALNELKARSPDLAILDVDMPGLSGLEVLREITRHRIRTRVILLTASISDPQIFDAIGLGVHGILLKDSASESLLESLQVVGAGRRWLPREVIDPAVTRENERRAVGRKLIAELSPREIEIVRIVAEGEPNKSIARRLGVTEGTIKIHLHNIYQKLEVGNRTTLAHLATSHQDLLHSR